jgi:hypothetical protein
VRRKAARAAVEQALAAAYEAMATVPAAALLPADDDATVPAVLAPAVRARALAWVAETRDIAERYSPS